MNLARIVHLFIAVTILVSISACSTLNTAAGGMLGLDTDLQLSFEVDADINPDEAKKPSPLYLRMYELKSTKMFNKSDFISIYERDSEILGADLISVQKIKPLKPGQNRVDAFVLDNKTTNVALYAEFLQYKGSIFRVVIPIATTNVVSTAATIRISGNTLKIVNGHEADETEADDESQNNKTLDKTKAGAKKTKDTTKKGQGVVDKSEELF